jgi:hypothetical protein
MTIDPIVQQLMLILTALAASQGFWTFFGAKITRTGKIERAVKGLLHDRLSYLVQKHIAADHISPEDFRIINELFEAYRDVGGNGNIARMMEAVMDLKIEIRESSA